MNQPLFARPLIAAVALGALGTLGSLQGCSKPEPDGLAQVAFDAVVASCTQYLASRTPFVRPGNGGGWTKTGYSPALVKPEVTRTESSVTPFVAKIVVKDNEAQAHASTEAEVLAIALTPAHLVSNRTHTFIYSFDGQRWHWKNGQRLVKVPGQNDRMEPVLLAEVAAAGPSGFSACLPR